MSSAQLKVSGEVLGEDFGVKRGVDGNEQQGGSVSKVTLEQPARGAAHSLKHPCPVSPSVQPVLHHQLKGRHCVCNFTVYFWD